MPLDSKQKTTIISEHARTPGDTGSAEVQIALLQNRISELTEHYRRHKGDHSTRRGLMKLVGRQRRLMRYLYGRDVERYRSIIAKLGIRDVIERRGVDRREAQGDT